MSPGTLDAYEESSSAKIQIGISSGADAGDVVTVVVKGKLVEIMTMLDQFS